MTKAAGAVLCLMLVACDGWPEPAIRSISPSEMIASEPTGIEILTSVTMPTTIDYERGEASVQGDVELLIGELSVAEIRPEPGGTLRAVIPTLLEAGNHPVIVRLDDGRSSSLQNGLTVRPGVWPDGYTIDPIGPQQRFVPFAIVVRAQGINASSFRGNVHLQMPAGAAIGPSVSDPFEGGVLVQQVVVSSTRFTESIAVRDAAGHTATSNGFALQ